TAQRAQWLRLVRFAVRRDPGAVEHAIAGRLQQDDAVMLTELRQALDRLLLCSQTAFIPPAVLEPVVIERQIDDRIRTDVVQQLGQAGGIPEGPRRTRRNEADVFLGTLGNQRLPQRAASTKQHQAHTHEKDSLPGQWTVDRMRRTGVPHIAMTLAILRICQHTVTSDVRRKQKGAARCCAFLNPPLRTGYRRRSCRNPEPAGPVPAEPGAPERPAAAARAAD